MPSQPKAEVTWVQNAFSECSSKSNQKNTYRPWKQQLKERGKKFYNLMKIWLTLPHWSSFNSSPPGQNGHHFRRQHFQMNFHDWKFCISIRISLRFVPKGPIDNKWALVPVMALHRIGDKPLPESMLIQFTDAALESDEYRHIYAALERDELST